MASHKVPYVHSNFARIPDDYYPTIDPRCTYAFLEHYRPIGLCTDVCAPNGSGIVNTLEECGFVANCLGDAFAPLPTNIDWIITNPPYDKRIVNSIIEEQIRKVAYGDAAGFAALLRSNFDFAKSRVKFFRDCPEYAGQIKMLFRPWWSEEKTASPIHNFVWHIWRWGNESRPIIMYSKGEKPK